MGRRATSLLVLVAVVPASCVGIGGPPVASPPSPQPSSGSTFAPESADTLEGCTDLFERYRVLPDIELLLPKNVLESDAGRREASSVADEWTRVVTAAARCNADYGPFEGGALLFLVHGIALDLAHTALDAKALRAAAELSMQSLVDDYPGSCLVGAASVYLESGKVRNDLIKDCAA